MKPSFPRGMLCGMLVYTVRLLAAEPVTAPIVPEIPAEDFFAEDETRDMQISPDGHYAAFLTTLGYGKVGIAMLDLNTGKPPEAFVSAQDENIKGFFWKGNDYIIYGGDIGGDESKAWRSVPVATPKPGEKRRVVALSEAYQERTNEEANVMWIVDRLRFDPLHMLIFGRKEVGSFTGSMFLIDVRNGNRTPIPNYDPPPADNEFAGFFDSDNVVDNNGALRARSRVFGKSTIFEVRAEASSPYVKVAEFPASSPTWEFVSFAADNETLYLKSAEHTDTSTLYSFNVRTHQLSAPLFNTPDGEISNVLLSWDRSKLTGVSYLTDKPHYKFFDATREKLQHMIDGALPATTNVIVGSSQDEKTMIILAYSDRDPGTYYVLNLTHGRMGPIGKVNSRINPAQMRPTEPITFKARDGLTIHGYLTRPALVAGQKIPLIIHPHGGPYGIRDDWGFDPEVQFLANRGYAVLQVNYRGSGGYGSSFEQAGYHEWGGKMQDDLTDSLKWAVDQGFVDQTRVAMDGASYGGYATLAGLVFTPELYCCGVNYVGPCDLSLLVGMAKSRGSSGSDVFYREHLGTNKDYLYSRSPVNFVDRIRVPLFNAYGYNDPRVDFKQWSRLESKLKQFKKNYEIVIEKDEGHGFRNESNRVAFNKRVEAFLDKYLKRSTVPTVKLGETKYLDQPAKTN